MKKIRYGVQKRKKISPMDFRLLSGLFYRIPGVATTAGRRQKTEAPMSAINEFFDKS
jgi:hypothetical protein